MKIQPDRLEGVNVINACTPERILVNGQAWTASVLVPWQGEVCLWSGALPGQVGADHFEQIVRFGPEVVIFGSGPTLHFAHPAVLRALFERRIGVETMDTAAACRTYNILAGEGRRVVAALLCSSG